MACALHFGDQCSHPVSSSGAVVCQISVVRGHEALGLIGKRTVGRVSPGVENEKRRERRRDPLKVEIEAISQGFVVLDGMLGHIM